MIPIKLLQNVDADAGNGCGTLMLTLGITVNSTKQKLCI